MSELSAVEKYDEQIAYALCKLGFTQSVEEGRLMLLELLVKANSGSYNSHTEEAFLRSFGMLKADRTANKIGRNFMCNMIYASSNRRPACYELMSKFRLETKEQKEL